MFSERDFLKRIFDIRMRSYLLNVLLAGIGPIALSP